MKPQFGKLRNDGPDLCTSADDFLDVPLGHLLRPVEAALLKGVMRYGANGSLLPSILPSRRCLPRKTATISSSAITTCGR
jgi:hypothetical protein